MKLLNKIILGMLLTAGSIAAQAFEILVPATGGNGSTSTVSFVDNTSPNFTSSYTITVASEGYPLTATNGFLQTDIPAQPTLHNARTGATITGATVTHASNFGHFNSHEFLIDSWTLVVPASSIAILGDGILVTFGATVTCYLNSCTPGTLLRIHAETTAN